MSKARTPARKASRNPAGNETPRGRANTLNDLTASEWVRHTRSWFQADGRPKDIGPDIQLHPASFPPDLVERFVRYFTKAGETVLDPFVGCGSTLVAAWENGRRSVGIEVSDLYYRNTVRRVAHRVGEPLDAAMQPVVIRGDAREVSTLVEGPVHFCITSPPYWNMLKKGRGNNDSVHRKRATKGLPTDYGDVAGDLGTIADYEAYLSALEEIFVAMRGVLEKRRYLVVVLQNVRVPGGEMRPLAWDFAGRMAKHYLLQQEFVWCQSQKQLGCWGWPTTYVSNVHHHYCLVFRNDHR